MKRTIFIITLLLIVSFLYSQNVIDNMLGVYNNSILIKQTVFNDDTVEVFLIERTLKTNKNTWIFKVEEYDTTEKNKIHNKQYYEKAYNIKPYFNNNYTYLLPRIFDEYNSTSEYIYIMVQEELWYKTLVRKYLPKELNNSKIIKINNTYSFNDNYIIEVYCNYKNSLFLKILSFSKNDLEFGK